MPDPDRRVPHRVRRLRCAGLRCQYGGTVADFRSRYIIVLAVAAGLILGVGSWLRPARNGGAPELSDSDLSRLSQLAQRQTADTLTQLFTTVAARVDPAVVRLRDLGTSGVIWSPGVVITSRRLEGPRVDRTDVTSASGTHQGQVTASGPTLHIMSLMVPGLNGSAPPRAPISAVSPGAWVLAVWRTPDRMAFATGHFVAVSSTGDHAAEAGEVTSTITLTPAMAGGGLFDLDGNLLALIVAGDDAPKAFAVDVVDAMLGSAGSLEGRLAGRYGLGVQPLSEADAAFAHVTAGVLVRDVWDDYAAARRGVAPGDVIVELDGQPVRSVADLAPLGAAAAPAAPVLTLSWQAQTRQVTLTDAPPATPAAAATPIGVVWSAEPPGQPVAAVARGSRADKAGLRAGDRILRADRVALKTPADRDRALAENRPTPVFLEVRRGTLRWGTLY